MPRITKELLSKEEDDIRRVLKEAFEKSLERLRELHPKAERSFDHRSSFGLRPFPVYITEQDIPGIHRGVTQFFNGANRRRLRVYLLDEFQAYLDDLDYYAEQHTPVGPSTPTIWRVSIGGRSRDASGFWDPPSIPGPERLNNPWAVWPTTATEVAVAHQQLHSRLYHEARVVASEGINVQYADPRARITLHTGNNVLSDPWRGAYTVSQDGDVTSLLDPRPDRQGIS